MDFDREDYRLALDYQISDDLMMYVSHSTGSRTGGWSSDNLAPVDEEELETTEIGIRSVIGGIRLILHISTQSLKASKLVYQVQVLLDVLMQMKQSLKGLKLNSVVI